MINAFTANNISYLIFTLLGPIASDQKLHLEVILCASFCCLIALIHTLLTTYLGEVNTGRYFSATQETCSLFSTSIGFPIGLVCIDFQLIHLKSLLNIPPFLCTKM